MRVRLIKLGASTITFIILLLISLLLIRPVYLSISEKFVEVRDSLLSAVEENTEKHHLRQEKWETAGRMKPSWGNALGEIRPGVILLLQVQRVKNGGPPHHYHVTRLFPPPCPGLALRSGGS